MRSKVKISKKEMKEDKFTTFMLQFKDRFLDNWQTVAIAAAVVVIIVVAAVYYSNMQDTKKSEASARLGKAISEYQRQNYQVAIVDFREIVDSYGGHTAERARFYLASAYFNTRNYDEAIKYFQQYVDKYRDDKIMRASAMAGIAASLEGKREFTEAGTKYEEALKYYPHSPSAPDYYLGAIRCFVAARDKVRSDRLLEEMKQEYSGTDFYRTASQLAMQLKI
jgi:TolA-binding protein